MKTLMSAMMAAAVVLLAMACGMPFDEQRCVDLDTEPPFGLVEAHAYMKIKPKPHPIKPPAQVPVDKTSYIIATTGNLYIAVDYVYVSGAHSQSVQVFAPDGSFYQGFDRAICIGTGCTGVKPETIGAVSQYWETLPVEGYPISQYNLTGTWRVDLWLDGVKTASGNVTMM